MEDTPLCLWTKYTHKLHIQILYSFFFHTPRLICHMGIFSYSLSRLMRRLKFIITFLSGEIMQLACLCPPAPQKNTVWKRLVQYPSIHAGPVTGAEGESWWICHRTTLLAELLISCLKPTGEQRRSGELRERSSFVLYLSLLLILQAHKLINVSLTADKCYLLSFYCTVC